ncbi:MAG TPA: prepilin-type N-terminal cleavage/methylation domain-containing protein [bacterium]|nr:prepilin-type N-terminal cleavage/methylation domain-containing protein [bacterium]HPP00255.1 prepilin-type N-terminal cleavage/methylation domain-containing protein [bacterium]
MLKKWSSSFTLIELLIVVAIIGILAAIAVPNFLNAQTRAKITRSYTDMGALHTALDMYFLDRNDFPRSNYVERYPTRPFRRLTTPVAYMSSFPSDPFRVGGLAMEHDLYATSGPDYTYYMCNDTDAYDGPATRGKPSRPADYIMSFDWFMMGLGPSKMGWIFYDITNGIRSIGCIYHSNSKEEQNARGGGYVHRPNQ